MGIRAFWILLAVVALAAAALVYPRTKAKAQTPADSGADFTVVDIAKDPAPEVVSTPVALPVEHQQALAPKPAQLKPDNGGIVEQERDPRLVRMPDGSLIVDHYFRIAGGKGTADDPYQLQWELLLSAQRNFDEPTAENALPKHIQFLDGKFVVLNGVTVRSAETGPAAEFVLTDMQMDNCPVCKARSIFATVAVKLKSAERMERGALNTYTVRGHFRAALVRDNGFLLGVYFLDDGEIVSRTRQ